MFGLNWHRLDFVVSAGCFNYKEVLWLSECVMEHLCECWRERERERIRKRVIPLPQIVSVYKWRHDCGGGLCPWVNHKKTTRITDTLTSLSSTASPAWSCFHQLRSINTRNMSCWLWCNKKLQLKTQTCPSASDHCFFHTRTCHLQRHLGAAWPTWQKP